jgi:hypothetical protein
MEITLLLYICIKTKKKSNSSVLHGKKQTFFLFSQYHKKLKQIHNVICIVFDKITKNKV